MNRLTPKHKLLAACAALLAVFALASAQGVSVTTLARVVLGLASLAGLAFWFSRRGGLPRAAPAPARLAVVARTGLSQRAGVALIEVDGRPFIVVHGDGYAQVHPTAAAQPEAPAVPFRALLQKEVTP
jgi:flagellar protein FliO/FliZ